MLADRVRMGSGDEPINPILYQAGDTGDNWIVREPTIEDTRLGGTVTFGSSYLEWRGNSGSLGGLYIKSPIDLSKYSYLELEFSSYNQPRITTRYDIQNINKKLYIEVFMGIPIPTMHYPTIKIVGWSHPSDFDEGVWSIEHISGTEFTWNAYFSKYKPNIELSQYIYRLELIK